MNIPLTWPNYKSPNERDKERQLKKHKETCTKKRKARKKSSNRKKT